MKRDGHILRSKEAICEDYDSSYIPYPLKNLLVLDYCWKLNYTLWKHSFYLAFPTCGCYFIYTRMPEVWSLTRQTFPYRSLAKTYVGAFMFINAYNTLYSLLLEDYCKRNSAIYDTKKRNAKVLRNLIKDTNTQHKKTVEGKSNTSLSDEEILNEK